MCGIVGAVAQRDVSAILLEGLKRLEYRGYDSAGMAIIDAAGELQRQRVLGKVKQLDLALTANPMPGIIGIAHTRWATHGVPCEQNAHPHTSHQEIALVHNGIIENFSQLREQLIKDGYQICSETDTEIIVHLIHQQLTNNNNLIEAVRCATSQLEGAFALGIIFKTQPQQLIAVRLGSPLLIGIGSNENFIASDQLALLPVTQQFIYLEDGDIAAISHDDYQIFDRNAKKITRKIIQSKLSHNVVDRGRYRHYMQKEIFEQPEALSAAIEGRLGSERVLEAIFGDNATTLFDNIERIQIVACGTSYHAGLVARYWFEGMAGIPCQVEVASEFRYRQRVDQANTLLITISQSGETADTLAALRAAKESEFISTLAICNVPESSLVREAELVFMTRAGVEIGVASTKSFTSQLTALLMLASVIGRRHGLSAKREAAVVAQLKSLPALIKTVLALDDTIQNLANKFIDKQHALFLGRGDQFPIALEGALKLKEISYIHAEAYPAGELKHGPLALVDAEMPVIAVAPNNHLLEKLKSNLEEVRSRGGELIVFADEAASLSNGSYTLVVLPSVPPEISPIIYSIPLQLLAYHVAVLKKTDIDQPRNLAKSVTVE